MFYGTNFHGTAELQPATFTGDAMFARATFGDGACFSGTTFACRASSGQAIFTGDVTFQRVAFGGDTDFSDATFADGKDKLPFKQTRVLSPVGQHVWPTGWGIGSEARPDI